jgi:hypothetical protein
MMQIIQDAVCFAESIVRIAQKDKVIAANHIAVSRIAWRYSQNITHDF